MNVCPSDLSFFLVFWNKKIEVKKQKQCGKLQQMLKWTFTQYR